MEEAFEKLSMTEKETFRRVLNGLFAHTYLLSGIYDFQEGVRKNNPDYLFAERHSELLSEYLEYAGMRLINDTNYGVIALESSFDANRVRFDKFTTVMLYTLRMIYEEEREKLSLSDEVFITTGDLVHKMIVVGAISKKPSNESLRRSLGQLAKFRIVQKGSGAWDSAETRMLLSPTLLFIVSNEQISNMHRLLDEDPLEDEEVEDETITED